MNDLRIAIPNGWAPRKYQRPLYNGFGYGKQFQRASVIWHRRAGKDSTVLNLTAREMFKRVGTYWHLFPEQAQARKAIWNGVDGMGRRIIDQFLPPDARAGGVGSHIDASPKSEQEMLLRALNGSTWQMAGSDNYDSLVGSNPVGVVFSEYALSNPAAWDYIRPILLENGGWAIFITTPRGRNHAYELHIRAQGNDEWFDQILTVEDTGIISPEQIQEERDSGMSDAKIAQEYYCSFEAEVDEQFMPSHVVDKCRKITDPQAEPDDPVILGVDVARFGDDQSVIYPRRGRDAQTIPFQKMKKLDTMQVAARVAETITQTDAQGCFVDETGLGAGVVDRLKQLGFHQVQGINFGSESDRRVQGAPKSANKRSEIWVTMREDMKSGVAIASDDALAFELLAPSYSYNASNEVQLEKKEDMKKRGIRSPDIADALALTYAYPVIGRSIEDTLQDQAAQDYDPIWGSG